MGLDGQINSGWVWVVGYGGGWVEMMMDGSMVLGESVGDGRIGGGQISGCGWVSPVPPPILVVLVVFCFCFVFFVFFFFKAALVDVGLCRWWLSMLLR